MNVRHYEFHPAANIFPMLSAEELTHLVDDIRENGLLDPIELYQGQILDGRNRYLAFIESGRPDEDFDSIDVTECVTDPVQYSLSKNLHRRHLSESQRGMVAAKIATMTVGKKSVNRTNSSDNEKSNTEAAKLLNVGTTTVKQAKKVQVEGIPQLVEAVERGEIKVSKAAKLATLPVEEQREAIEGGREEVNQAVKRVEQTKKKSPTKKPFDIAEECHRITVKTRMLLDETLERWPKEEHETAIRQVIEVAEKEYL